MITSTLRIASVLLVLVVTAACGTRSHTEVTSPSGATVESSGSTSDVLTPEQMRRAQKIQVMEGRPDRAYDVLGDLKIRLSKNTAFDPTPTPTAAARQLRIEAAKLGADAVIDVVYDGPKVTLFSWGTMDATGTAVRFK